MNFENWKWRILNSSIQIQYVMAFYDQCLDTLTLRLIVFNNPIFKWRKKYENKNSEAFN